MKEQARDRQQDSEGPPIVNDAPQPITPKAPAHSEPLPQPAVVEQPKPLQNPQQVEQLAADSIPAKLPANLADLVAKIESSVVRIETQTKDSGGIGSGFVADAKGWIITNYHVIEGAKQARVIFHDGTSVAVAGFLCVEPAKDIAVLSVERNDAPLVVLPLSATACRKGESTIALGAPKGLAFSVSSGIVSAVRTYKEILDGTQWRSMGFDLDSHWVQTTAPISPGNSGGPLVNEAGEVIGINTWYRSDGQNLNFAIAAQHIRELMTKCKEIQPLEALPAPGLVRTGTPNDPEFEALRSRVIERLGRLKLIYEQEAEVAARQKELTPPIETLTSQLQVLQGEYASIAREVQSIQLSLNSQTALQAEVRLPLQSRLAVLDANSAKLNVLMTDVSTRLSAANSTMQQLAVQAAQLRMKWFVLADPFGKLSRIEHQIAIAIHSEWIIADGQQVSPYICRGLAYMHIGDLKAARADLTRAVILGGPMQSLAYTVSGGIKHALGDERDGMADFGKVLEIDKADWLARMTRGIVLASEGKIQTAEKDFKSAISNSFNNPEPYRLMAKLFATLAQPSPQNGAKAVANATKACELTKWQDWSCVDVLAAAYAQSGAFNKAVETAKKAAELAPFEIRSVCLEHLKLYEDKQTLRDDWKKWYLAQGSLSVSKPAE